LVVVLEVMEILLGLSTLLVLLLAVPFGVTFRFEGIGFKEIGFEGKDAFKGQIAIRWMFGLVRFRIPVPGATKPQDSTTKQKTQKKRAKPGKRRSRRNFFAVLRQAAFRRRVYRLVRDLIHAAHADQLRLRIRLGLGDPADTGRLWALVGPLNAAARNLHNAEVQIEPEFMDTVLKFQADGRLMLVPLRFLVVAIAFALSPSSIRAWRTLNASHA
jgi:hypothetical protein